MIRCDVMMHNHKAGLGFYAAIRNSKFLPTKYRGSVSIGKRLFLGAGFTSLSMTATKYLYSTYHPPPPLLMARLVYNSLLCVS